MHQDAHEFLNYLLNEISEILEKNNREKFFLIFFLCGSINFMKRKRNKLNYTKHIKRESQNICSQRIRRLIDE